ncbi:hypothetical protein Vafri_19893 [Volvox africanus]|uniref:Uncharacterized protein n=1 Tax=Volvox africanus TaxID=51714 RepID=A0A8J4FCJ9_9CHLO|nr:hypothetical protein Vafri_19893 [Volvox africanus]
MFRRRNNKEQEKDVLEKEVAFWKTEMEKVVNEKNIWIERYMKASEDNEMLRAELFLVQQDVQSTRAHLEVLRVREECRMAHSPAVGVGSSTGTPQSGRAGFGAAGPALGGSFGPSATSANTSPSKYGGGGSGIGVVSPCDRSMVQHLEGQVADLKAELGRAHRQVAAAEAAAHSADMRVALLEERLVESGQELEAARRQTEFMRATAEAHQREANALRAEVLSQRSINDETANETTKILSELSSAQQRCAKLASELSIKEQMVGLLKLQLGDFAAAAAVPGVNSSTPGLASQLAAAAAPSSALPSRSVSLSSSGWGLAPMPPSGRTSSGGLGGGGDGVVPSAEAEPAAEVQRERPAAVAGGGGGPNVVEWPSKVLDSPEDGGKSPSLIVLDGGDGHDGSSSAGGSSAIGSCGGSMWAAAAVAAALDGFPASMASPASGPTACCGSSANGTPSPSRPGDSFKANGKASAAITADAAKIVDAANSGSEAVAEVPRGTKLAFPKLTGVATLSGVAPSSATAATLSAAVAVAETAGPTFQEAAMQVDPTPSHQPPAILRKILSKGFAAATAAATAGSPQVQPPRPHLHYHQQRPANVPQLQLGSALRGLSSGGAADANAATPTAENSGTNGVRVSTSPAVVIGKRVAAEKKEEEVEAPAPKRTSAIGMASTVTVTAGPLPPCGPTVAASIEEESEETTEGAVAASAAAVIAEATTAADIAVMVIVDGGERKPVPSDGRELGQGLAEAVKEAVKEKVENEEKKENNVAETQRFEDSYDSGLTSNDKGSDDRAREPSKTTSDTASASSIPSGSGAIIGTEVTAAGGAAKTAAGPAVLAPRAFRFPGNRAAAVAAPASSTPPKALGATPAATPAVSSVSGADGIPRTPFGFAARRSSGGGGASECGGTAATAAAVVTTPPPPSSAEPAVATGTPGGGNGAACTASASRGGVSNTLSLLKRFNSGGLGSEPCRDKSPAPSVVVAAEGPTAGSGLSAVAAAVRRISGVGAADVAATLPTGQDNWNNAMEPPAPPIQPTPPKRQTPGTGVSTLLNKFNSVSGSGTPPTPPPAPGSVSAAVSTTTASGSGIPTVVVPEYGIGGPATRVPASAKIAAMRSAYEKNKS